MTEPFAIRGNQGQLFLGGDNNDSLGQFTEDRDLAEESIASWSKMIARMRALPMPTAFVVAPAKEEILTQYYPYPRAPRTVVDRFMARFKGADVIMPKWPLRARGVYCYCETDTHWTDLGATVAAAETLIALGLPENARESLPQYFRLRQRIGDLGNKIDPPVASYEMSFSPSLENDRKVYDNTIPNNGNIRIFENKDAPIKEHCLIFGDSFGTNFSLSLSNAFRRVSYAYRPGAIDDCFLSASKPDRVVLEITQRFLHGQPVTHETLYETAVKKIESLPAPRRQEVLEHLRATATAPFGEFSQIILNKISP